MTEADQEALAEIVGRLRGELRREFEARFERLERERRTAGSISDDAEKLFRYDIPNFLPERRAMMTPATPAEAMFAIECAVLTASIPCAGIRFCPYPDPDRRLVLVCAELVDGRDIQVLARLDWPIDMTGDDYDEAAIARAFRMESQSTH